MIRHSRLAMVAAAIVAASPLAFSTTATAKQAPSRTCFHANDWNGWTAPSPNVIYIRVTNRDIYRADLVPGPYSLTAPDTHLINKVQGSTLICSPVDLNLSASQGEGFRTAIIVKSLTKLSDQEVAAIPKKWRP